MANSLRNIASILSPNKLSPLVAASGVNKRFHFNPDVVKKLDFSPKPTKFALFSPALSHNKPIPDIKIDDFAGVIDNRIDLQSPKTLENIFNINTPIKLDLVQNGIEKFKQHLTVLGKGRFGTVFKAKFQGNLAAVKIINKENSSQERNALGLHHKNILQTYEIIENPDGQKYSLVMMQYLPKCKDLQEVLNNFQSLTVDNKKTLKRFSLDIANGLDYLHKNGLMHLDLKPKNVLVDSEGVCKICDFGNSAKVGQDFGQFNYNGTAIYTAPEILLGDSPSMKSDIYSLGLIFWQFNYLKVPYEDYGTVESIIYKVGKYGLRPSYNSNDQDILGLAAIFTQCWNSDPALRPNTTEILQKLQEIAY